MSLKWNQIAVGFLAGLVIGCAVVASPLRRYLRESWDKRPHHERMLDKLSSRLSLTPEQKTKMAAIFEAKRSRIEALMAEGRPKFDAVREETRAEIRKILTPEQIAKFETLEAKMEKRFKKRFPPRH